MKYYYQYDIDNVVNVRIKSNSEPTTVKGQLVLDVPLSEGRKTFDEDTLEITFWKYTKNGEEFDIVKDTTRKAIKLRSNQVKKL